MTLGVARYSADPDWRSAEFAVAVRSDWHGRGVGQLLKAQLIEVAQQSARGSQRQVAEAVGSSSHLTPCPSFRLAPNRCLSPHRSLSRAAAPVLWGPKPSRRLFIPVPPEANDAVEAPQISPQDLRPEKLLEADNSPDPVKKAEPRKADNCGHCGKPLPFIRSAASRYCSRKCTRAAAKARKVELPR
jgi:hypothetical protein